MAEFRVITNHSTLAGLISWLNQIGQGQGQGQGQFSERFVLFHIKQLKIYSTRGRSQK